MNTDALQGFRLSPQQARLWELWRNRPGTGLAIQAEISIDGPLDPEVLRRALDALVDRHEVLRTRFLRLPGMALPIQTSAERGCCVLERLELAGLEAERQQREVERVFAEQLERPFDLEAGAVLRGHLSRLADERHVLIVSLCPLCGDGRSLEVLLDELFATYAEGNRARRAGAEGFRYVQFSEWRNAMLAEDDPELTEHWRPLHAAAPARPLPFQLPEGSAGDRRGTGRVPVPSELDETALRRLDQLCEARRIAVEDVFLAAWMVLVARTTGEGAVTIGELYGFRDEEVVAQVPGLFAGYLGVRAPVRPDVSFAELAEEVARLRSEGREMAEGFVWDREATEGNGRVAAIPWGFQRCDWPRQRAAGDLRFTRTRRHVAIDRLWLELALIHTGEHLRLELTYDRRCFDRGDIERLARQLSVLSAAALEQPSEPLARLPLLDEVDRRRLLHEFNPRPAEPAEPCPFHRLFERCATETPDAPAVVFEERSATYAELNARANRLARGLREIGVGPEHRVAMCVDRSLEAIVGVLAILKAGGAYVALDPSQPSRRLGVFLEEALAGESDGPRVVLTQRRWADRLPDVGARPVLFDADEERFEGLDATDLEIEVAPQSLAYVVFTSGSTGRPKGVAVAHSQLSSYLGGVVERLGLPARASYATVSTLSADLGNTMIFPALATGGVLHVVSEQAASEPAVLEAYFARHGIDCLKIVPSHLEALLAGRRRTGLLPRQRLVLGGEALRWQLAERLLAELPSARIFNHYGPSETTVGVLTCEVEAAMRDPRLASVPIGRPLPHAQAFVLDAGLAPVPEWSAGGLYVGGAGVSRGYLGSPRLTAERFVPDPWGGAPGGRLYRSGDLARRVGGGRVEFLGRQDHQVKLNGFRIELGEVRAALVENPKIRDAVVTVAREEGHPEALVGYYVSRRPIDTGELREGLRQRLLEAAIPKLFCHLRSLPLTLNGKVNLRALPGLEEVKKAVERRSTPPRTPAESQLAAIWSELLRTPSVSIDDNFFELGGDSILAIQVAARCQRLGLPLKPQQIFLHPTIEELAALAGTGMAAVAEQGVVSGRAPLMPIQRWFFEQSLADPHHWNQTLLLTSERPLDLRLLEAAVRVLRRHHDALRLRFEADAERRWATYDPPDASGSPSAAQVDLTALEERHRASALTAAASGVQSSLDPEAGVVLRVVLFELGAQLGSRLLAAAHHLVVDAVSWRILLEDLEAVLGQLRRGERPALPVKTTSFKRWAQELARLAGSEQLAEELPYWQALGEVPAEALPPDWPEGENTVASSTTIEATLGAEETRALLREVPAVYKAQVNEALLAALARAIATLTGSSRVLVELEGHGREPLSDEVDTTRTVGWLTTFYPLCLDVGERGRGDPGEALARVKEQLRRVPHRGIGFGLLRYLCERDGVQARMRSLPVPQVKLNYLGQLDAPGGGERPSLRLAPESCGPDRSPRGRRSFPLEVEAHVLGERLHLAVRYSAQQYREASVEELVRSCLGELRALVERCRQGEPAEYVPADFPLAQLDERRLEKLASVLDRLDGLDDVEGGLRES